ncbi:sodium/calcium exchanger NCL-like [Primulina huaijiensis]|uniref:sodium/calcium exchanger NCL-like n=1 Tax=Primulina huaijiensis TaxID=1492673 RepID=UPI003CC6EDE8
MTWIQSTFFTQSVTTFSYHLAMAALALNVIVLIFFSSIVQGRIIQLSSSNDLISDGVSDVENYPSSYIVSSTDSSPGHGGCSHAYGFLPCAENAGGFIFQIIVYQGLLIYGERQLGKGSKVLFHILGTGKFGGIIFRILMALPSMMLMIVSGVFMDKESAESQVSVGIGIYAGSTVFSLTLHWGVCVIFGRRDLPQKSTTGTSCSDCLPANEKPLRLRDTGVSIDRETLTTAGIMLGSLIPYIAVQLVNVFKNLFANRLLTLIALLVTVFSLLSYFLYQILNPWIQERSLDYSKYEILRAGFLKHVRRLGNIVNEDGKLNASVINKLFTETDKDKSQSITKTEIEKLVLDIMESGKMKIDNKYAVSEIMKTFDFDSDMRINEHEFINGCKKWIDETSSSEHGDPGSGHIFHELFQVFKEKKEDDPKEIDRIMSKILKHAQTRLLRSESLIAEDGRPNIERIQTLFKQFDTDKNKSISKSELEQLISTVKFGEIQQNVDIVKELLTDFDQDNNGIIDEPEFVAGVTKWLNKAVRIANTTDKTKSIDEFDKIVWKQEVHDKWAFIISVIKVLFGIVVLTFLGGPLTESILRLSYSMNLPSFCIAFVIVPLAMNARSLIAAILPASRKSERSASLTFSEIYGGVIMNNLSGLTTLLAIVYAKALTWNYSAEVLTIFVVCAIIGFMAYSRTTYPLWTCLLAFLLYPFSLGLFCFAQFFWSWK